MADFVFNIAKGRVAEFVNRVKSNDPATARLVIIPLEAAGLETQANLEDSDFLSEVLDGATNEQTTMGRKFLADTDLAAGAGATPDDTNNRMDVDIPDITWTAATGNALGALVVAYDPNSSADAAIIPLTHHTFAVTPDGSDIVAVINAAGFYRAA
jgi:hypothetical protein